MYMREKEREDLYMELRGSRAGKLILHVFNEANACCAGYPQHLILHNSMSRIQCKWMEETTKTKVITIRSNTLTNNDSLAHSVIRLLFLKLMDDN